MNKHEEMYAQKLTTPAGIAQLISSGDICASPAALAEPDAILEALAVRALAEDLTGITHHLLLPLRRNRYLEPELEGRIIHVSWFSSAFSRKAVHEGRADYFPTYYSEVPRHWEEHVEADVFYGMVSPMDMHGYFSFGVTASEAASQIKRAKKVFLEVNNYMPRVLGDCFVHISQVDAICEYHKPLPEIRPEPPNEKDIAIAGQIVDLIPDGATIQLGIGAMPNLVGTALAKKKNLGIHTEMFTECMVELMESGAVDNSRKKNHPGKTVACFSFGSQAVYDFIHDNPGVEFYPISHVNDPRVIAQNDNVMSINACLEVDFIGQVCSETLGYKSISGSGGQVDFVRGAHWSQGGRSFIATYSTAKDDTISRIRPVLTSGSHVTTSKNEVDYIVTEYGIAHLKGKRASERVKALIAIAHPKFRDELLYEAKKMKFVL